ncbi:MAG: FkbM family methyltransferase [Nitrospiraceae bacterium]
MRALLRRFLSAHQIIRLRALRDSMRKAAVSIWSTVCHLLPERVVLFLKSHTILVKKMDYEPAEILLQIESEVEYGTRLQSCAKEPETIEWIHTCFQEGDVYFDVGANVGAYALVAAKRFGGKVRVYAFEPSFPTFKQLCTNIVLNNCQECIVPLQVALSDRTALEVLNYSSLLPGGALHALGQAVDYKGDRFQPVVKQSVLSFALDDLIRQFALPLPTHIKLDVDGTELSILKGAKMTLASVALRSVLVEILEGDPHSAELVSLLERSGMKLHSKHKYVHGGDSGPASRMYNYIFCR